MSMYITRKFLDTLIYILKFCIYVYVNMLVISRKESCCCQEGGGPAGPGAAESQTAGQDEGQGQPKEDDRRGFEGDECRACQV